MSAMPDNFEARVTRWRRRHALAARRIAGVLLSVLSLWFVGWLSVGDQILVVRWGAFIAPWLGILTLATAALFLLGSRRWWALATFTLALLILTPVLPRFNPARWFSAPRSADLTVMTFNVSMLNHDYHAIARLIAREQPDIVFVQQLGDLEALRRALRLEPGHRDYHSFPSQTADTAIFSRFALSDGQTFEYQASAVATVGGCRVRLWSLHAPHGQFDMPAQKKFFGDIAGRLRSETLPLIVGGDFNSTEFNSVQAPLRSEAVDAFAAVGTGLGFTFPSRVRRLGTLGPLFRIDHILVRDLVAVSASVLSDGANSDHLPTIASLALSKVAGKSCPTRSP